MKNSILATTKTFVILWIKSVDNEKKKRKTTTDSGYYINCKYILQKRNFYNHFFSSFFLWTLSSWISLLFYRFDFIFNLMENSNKVLEMFWGILTFMLCAFWVSRDVNIVHHHDYTKSLETKVRKTMRLNLNKKKLKRYRIDDGNKICTVHK